MEQDKQVISEDVVRKVLQMLEDLKQQSDNHFKVDFEMIQQLLSQFGLSLHLS